MNLGQRLRQCPRSSHPVEKAYGRVGARNRHCNDGVNHGNQDNDPQRTPIVFRQSEGRQYTRGAERRRVI